MTIVCWRALCAVKRRRARLAVWCLSRRHAGRRQPRQGPRADPQPRRGALSLSLLYCWRLGRVSLALGRSAETGDTLLYARVATSFSPLPLPLSQKCTHFASIY